MHGETVKITSLHVSNNPVLIIRRINCINTSSGIYNSVCVAVWYAGQRHAYQTATHTE